MSATVIFAHPLHGHLQRLVLKPKRWLQVKVQTQPGYAKGLMDGMPKLISEQGIGG